MLIEGEMAAEEMHSAGKANPQPPNRRAQEESQLTLSPSRRGPHSHLVWVQCQECLRLLLKLWPLKEERDEW